MAQAAAGRATDAGAAVRVLYVGHFSATEGQQLFDQANALQLEGIVAKRLGSVYQAGVRSTDWTKVKCKRAVPPERFKRS